MCPKWRPVRHDLRRRYHVVQLRRRRALLREPRHRQRQLRRLRQRLRGRRALRRRSVLRARVPRVRRRLHQSTDRCARGHRRRALGEGTGRFRHRHVDRARRKQHGPRFRRSPGIRNYQHRHAPSAIQPLPTQRLRRRDPRLRAHAAIDEHVTTRCLRFSVPAFFMMMPPEEDRPANSRCWPPSPGPRAESSRRWPGNRSIDGFT